MTMRIQNVLCGAAIAAVSCGLAGAVHAQTPPPAGEYAAQVTAGIEPLPPLPEPGPLPPPASCGAQNCLALEISDAAVRSLGRGADPAEFAEGISFSFEGAGVTPAVYFIAARYEDGRLTQYDYTGWIRPQAGGGQAIDGAVEAVAKAARDLAGRQARIAAASRSTPLWTVPVQTQSFMIESPRTRLIGAPDTAAIDEATAPEDLVAAAEDGSLLLLTVAPADQSLRSPEQAAVTGVIVRLETEE